MEVPCGSTDASRRVTTPVPAAISSTRPGLREATRSARSAAYGAKISGTRCSSYNLGMEPAKFLSESRLLFMVRPFRCDRTHPARRRLLATGSGMQRAHLAASAGAMCHQTTSIVCIIPMSSWASMWQCMTYAPLKSIKRDRNVTDPGFFAVPDGSAIVSAQ